MTNGVEVGMFQSKKRTNAFDTSQRIGELYRIIEEANRQQARAFARIPKSSLIVSGDKIEFHIDTIRDQIEVQSKIEREAKHELMEIFADMFYDLNMAHEWSAVTIAMNIMRRTNEQA